MLKMSRKVKSRKLPSRALQLIREYSKPITRGDWRTFPRITKEKFVKYKNELHKYFQFNLQLPTQSLLASAKIKLLKFRDKYIVRLVTDSWKSRGH
jgi:hypothetical protein